MVQTKNPWHRAILNLRTFIWTNLVKEEDKAMLLIKYQAPEQSGAEEEIF